MSDRPDPFAPRPEDPATPGGGGHDLSRHGRFGPVPEGRPDVFAPRAAQPPRGAQGPVDAGDPRATRQPDAPRPERVSLQKHASDREQAAKDRLKRVGGPLGLAALLAWKVGRIALVALGKVAILFKIPLLGTVLSGLISIGAYAVFYGWSFAIGLVGSLLVHELGHVVQIKREGMPVKALNFVPFLGAYVLSDGARSADQQARVSIAGPIAGTLLAVAVYVVAAGDPMLEAIAYTGFFLNLFNLLPIPMLDGGGVGGVFNSAWWLGIAAVLGVVALASGVGFAAIAALAALLMVYLHRSGGFALEPNDGVPRTERLKAALLYVAVIAVCAFGMASSFRDRTDHLVDQYGTAGSAVVATR